jgi:hypothetical protein
MGYNASEKNIGVKYLITRPKEPYCAYPYLLELTLGILEKKTIGSIIISYGDNPVKIITLTK